MLRKGASFNSLSLLFPPSPVENIVLGDGAGIGVEKSYRKVVLSSLGLHEVLEGTLHGSCFSILSELSIVTR